MICGERIAMVMPSIWTRASRGSIEPEKSRPVTMLASVQIVSAHAIRPAKRAQATKERAIRRRTAHSIRPAVRGVKPNKCAAVLQPVRSNRRLNVHRDLRNELERECLHQRLGLVRR